MESDSFFRYDVWIFPPSSSRFYVRTINVRSHSWINLEICFQQSSNFRPGQVSQLPRNLSKAIETNDQVRKKVSGMDMMLELRHWIFELFSPQFRISFRWNLRSKQTWSISISQENLSSIFLPRKQLVQMNEKFGFPPRDWLDFEWNVRTSRSLVYHVKHSSNQSCMLLLGNPDVFEIFEHFEKQIPTKSGKRTRQHFLPH